MLLPSQGFRTRVATKPVGFRKGHDGLAALIPLTLTEGPLTGTLRLLRPRRADRLEIQFWDGSGLVMAYKQLEDSTFTWPAICDRAMPLNRAQSEALFWSSALRVVRQTGTTSQTFYPWWMLNGGMQRSQLARLKEPEKENQWLRRAESDLTLDKLVLTEAA